MRGAQSEPTFLAIRWELPGQEQPRMVVQAKLCLAHPKGDRPPVPERPRLRAARGLLRLL
jgi:hypothetical protein